LWQEFEDMFSFAKICTKRLRGNFFVFALLILILIPFSIGGAHAQNQGDIFSSSALSVWARILKPSDGQQFESGQDIEISGDLSTGISRECDLSISLNGVNTAHNIIRDTGGSGISKWSKLVHEAKLNEGQNTITAKLSCSNSKTGSSHTITVTGNKPNLAEPVDQRHEVTSLEQASNYGSYQKNGFDVVAAGDYGCNAVTGETVKKMKETNPDLYLALGDLSEDKDPGCFFDLFSKADDNGKLKITLGEHDTDSNDEKDSSSRFSQFLNHFGLDKPYYSFDYRNVHFLAMSTGKDELVPFGEGSPQYNFTVNDLAKASNNKEIKWIIVYGYRPFYSSPTVHPASGSIRDVYQPLFQKYGVDLVITTHNHNYQRTYPLKLTGGGDSEPRITDKNNSTYVNPNGPIFITVGTAGEELHDLEGKYPFVVTQFKSNGFLNIHFSNNGTELTATFLDNVGNRNTDNFSLKKL
jgi:calcineurin-like phosphoesterase family protein